MAGASENVGDAIIGGSPGVAPAADVAACVAAAVIDAGMPACVAACVAAFVASATTTCFKKSILCLLWCFCCGCLWVSVGVGWSRLVGLLFDSYYIIHII